ncbi:radical SAM family heme chaperone HemW [Ornithinimicrobium sp. Arc0846-15]|nr:radical SAM family heme chaperone HemW [Ornithinimicrobium laminariae]
MPALPTGDPVPADGALPSSALATIADTEFALYLHVPFCRVRCGYCDFNTYTKPELGGHGATIDTFADAAIAEMDVAQDVLTAGGANPPAVSTIFIGGGTPTMLPAADLVRMVAAARERWGFADNIEITTEANPDTITPEIAVELAAGGFTRVSLGMQSAVPSVLATLERTHDPANVATALRACRAAGLAVSLDLIYGTPGETLGQWRMSLEEAIDLEPDHLSAYALTIEEGTKMGAQVKRGQLPTPDDDDEADKYELASELLMDAGYEWYEISNWSRGPATQCRHNLGYWRGVNWWGIGPGAHSHVGGVRWWNVKHPAAYASRLAQGLSPAHSREVLTAEQRSDEDILLGVRLAQGYPIASLPHKGRGAIAPLIGDGLIGGRAALRGSIVLTQRGRLLADTVVHHLING